MNRIATILNLADDTLKMNHDDLHRFVMQILRRLSPTDLQIINLEQEIKKAEKL